MSLPPFIRPMTTSVSAHTENGRVLPVMSQGEGDSKLKTDVTLEVTYTGLSHYVLAEGKLGSPDLNRYCF